MTTNKNSNKWIKLVVVNLKGETELRLKWSYVYVCWESEVGNG